jgi:hypothetical protein
MDDATIHDLVLRLSRPHASGGVVIERAAILAEGAVSGDVIEWIVSREGRGESAGAASSGGLHGGRRDAVARDDRPPQRYILPVGAVG